jgi:hypothetical protein
LLATSDLFIIFHFIDLNAPPPPLSMHMCASRTKQLSKTNIFIMIIDFSSDEKCAKMAAEFSIGGL